MKSPSLFNPTFVENTFKNFFVLLSITLVVLFNSCDEKHTEGLNPGVLMGIISIGPLCPVETIPPDPNCQPTEATFKAWPIGVWTADKKSKVSTLKPNLDGSYDFELQEGSYVVDLEVQHHFGSNLPATIMIAQGVTTVLDIEIDTGIR